MYEQRKHELLPWPGFFRRATSHLLVAIVLGLVAVGIGTTGYHLTANLGWVDSFLNASMILSGMGPVDHLETTTAKIFAALYALFSGLMFVGVIGIVVAPWLHRLFHWFHLEDGDPADS
jgi:hypothetical protein